MRFLCDRMLGRLARWLRMMGTDVLYPEEVPDSKLLSMAVSSERMLLTRDRELAARAGELGLYIEGHGNDEQILEFVRTFGMPGDWFTRCTVCNGPLSADESAGVTGTVPERVGYKYRTIWTCRSCGQTYWPGTQYASVLQKLTELRREGCCVGEACDGPR